MPVHIIIDGYNLIRQSARFADLDRKDLQAAREALLEALAAYRRVKPHKITVVFDGANAPYLSPARDVRRGIEVKFSRNGEPADTVIKRMASRDRARALVVSSDADIAHFADSQGAATISSQLFEQRIAQTSLEMLADGEVEDSDGWVPTTRKKGPSRRQPKRQRRNRIRIGKI